MSLCVTCFHSLIHLINPNLNLIVGLGDHTSSEFLTVQEYEDGLSLARENVTHKNSVTKNR